MVMNIILLLNEESFSESIIFMTIYGLGNTLSR